MFLKPKAAKVATNLTVLTNRRRYQIEYTAIAQRPECRRSRRHFRGSIHLSAACRRNRSSRCGGRAHRCRARRRLGQEAAKYRLLVLRKADACGQSAHPTMVCTRDYGLRQTASCRRFSCAMPTAANRLLNFSMDAGDVIVHRVAPRFILRRGKLDWVHRQSGIWRRRACGLDSGTVTPEVERLVPGVVP